MCRKLGRRRAPPVLETLRMRRVTPRPWDELCRGASRAVVQSRVAGFVYPRRQLTGDVREKHRHPAYHPATHVSGHFPRHECLPCLAGGGFREKETASVTAPEGQSRTSRGLLSIPHSPTNWWRSSLVKRSLQKVVCRRWVQIH